LDEEVMGANFIDLSKYGGRAEFAENLRASPFKKTYQMTPMSERFILLDSTVPVNKIYVLGFFHSTLL
jgi:hypothetical protein